MPRRPRLELANILQHIVQRKISRRRIDMRKHIAKLTPLIHLRIEMRKHIAMLTPLAPLWLKDCPCMEDRSMRILQLWLQRIAKLGLLLTFGVSVSGCSSTMSWKEEVLLKDGQKIIAERRYNLGGYPAIESQNRAALDETVTFNLPNSKSIEWKTDFRDSVPTPNSLNLIRFDVVKGVPYIATYPAGCIAYNKWQRPNPPQILFKYENDRWQRITLEEFPAVLVNAQANVIVGRPDARIAKSFYSVEGVNAVNHDIHAPAYKTILREALPVNQLCPEWVYFEGSWVTPSVIESEKRYRQLIQKEQEAKKRASDQKEKK